MNVSKKNGLYKEAITEMMIKTAGCQKEKYARRSAT